MAVLPVPVGARSKA